MDPGAHDGTRTRDLFLTKEVLYHLSYVGTTSAWSGKRDSNPRPSAWKADALAVELFPQKRWWTGVDSNHRSQLATGLQPAPFSCSGARPRVAPFITLNPTPLPAPIPSTNSRPLLAGAGDGTRTHNLLITNQLLCQLSYASQVLP